MTDEFDPTTNRVPFELLTKQERNVLRSWPHGIEFYASRRWYETDTHMWSCDVVYRGKPAPVVTSKWVNVYSDGLTSLHNHRSEYYLAGCKPIAVLRIDTCNGVSTAHIEEL